MLTVAGACSDDDDGDDTAGSGDIEADQPAEPDEPQELTTEQAERLAAVRFSNYRAGTGVFSTMFPAGTGEIELHGIVDWRNHLGSAVYRDAADEPPAGTEAGLPAPQAGGLVQWSLSHVARHEGGDVDGLPPAPPEDGQWQLRNLDPSAETLDTMLSLLLNLGSDRPENPQLIAQSSARFVGTDSIDGVPVSIFTGPGEAGASTDDGGAEAESRTRFWIDDEGTMRRFEARLGGSPTFVAVDFDVDQHPKMQMIPDFPTPESTNQQSQPSTPGS